MGFNKAVPAQCQRACKKTASKPHGAARLRAGGISCRSPALPCIPPVHWAAVRGPARNRGSVKSAAWFCFTASSASPRLGWQPAVARAVVLAGQRQRAALCPSSAREMRGFTPPVEKPGRIDAMLQAKRGWTPGRSPTEPRSTASTLTSAAAGSSPP